jgi:hypothetical protein
MGPRTCPRRRGHATQTDSAGGREISSSRRRGRAGFTLLEAQVSFVLLGVALAGVGPIVVFQMKLSRRLQQGANPQTGRFGTSGVAHLIAHDDPWMRKLGASATIAASGGPPAATPPITPAYDVAIVAPVVKTLTGEEVTVYVTATPHPKGSGP